VSSKFNSRSPVTQPPPICRRRPPRGPFKFNWPPSQAEAYVHWLAPPGWPAPYRVDAVVRVLWNPLHNSYRHTIYRGPGYVSIETMLSGSPFTHARTWLTAVNGSTWFGGAYTQLLPITQNTDLHLHGPPFEWTDPGHEFRFDLTAIFETVGNRIAT